MSMKVKEFIDLVVKFDNVSDILENYQSASEKGQIFERLWDILIKFGFSDFKNNDYFHLIGNSNNGVLKNLENLSSYLDQKVVSGNSGGCSDITLKSKKDNRTVYISCKYFNKNEKKNKKVDQYDIQKIVAMADENKHIHPNYDIYLLVVDKTKVLDKVKTANKSSNYITKFMTDDKILDIKDLNKSFLAFKKDILLNWDKDWHNLYVNQKDRLEMRFHQELITAKTSLLIQDGSKSFLWGCKCRSGKTYMIGGIIINQLKIKKKLNVLIITPAPTETSPQFIEGLFNKFMDFDNFKVHNIIGSNMIETMELGDSNIIVISKQLVQKYSKENTIKKIKNLNLDIIGFDENHFTGTTDISKDILSSYSSKNTVKIYLTATYNKPLKEWGIDTNCQMFWDIEDEQICKSILKDDSNLSKLKEKHGDDYISSTVKHYNDLGLSIKDIFKIYERMPDLHLITSLLDQERYESINEKLKKNKENKMGFSFDTLLSLNTSKTKFNYENEVATILRYISGSNKEEDGDKTIFPRINKICAEKDTRHSFTQIWFVPSINVNEISKCLKKLMNQDLILKKYDVLCVNRKNKDLAKEVKDEIVKKQTEAKNKGKLGLIILAGNMLTLGITLDLCDLVFLMNDTLSSDKVLQQMYRSMTEGRDKKIGFVVDLNISRVINTCVNYTIYKNENSIYDKLSYLVKNHLINIDVDMMDNKKVNCEYIIQKLMDIWKTDPINSCKTLLKKLEDEYIHFDSPTQSLINKTFSKTTKSENITLNLVMKNKDDEIQGLPSGREIIKQDSEQDSEQEREIGKVEEQLVVSITKDVLPYVIPLSCILTRKDSNMDFLNMLSHIKEDPILMETFDSMSLIWWGKTGLLNFIKSIVRDFFNKKSNIYNITVQFKMSLQSLVDNPKELLELIDDCLKPKEVEKKQFGEVFTPMKLVNEMLDKLPPNVWKNKNLKWMDPASGMGNFPIAVYLRLMDSLKEEILDEKLRKKHILENMLYMSELNKKNILVCKQIFDINNEYKLNLYEGNSLELDTNKEWGVEKFDVIMGNPPYNDKCVNGKSIGWSNILWDKFVKIYIKKLNKDCYLCFVHPSAWRKPVALRSKTAGLFELMIKDNQMLYLEIHDTKDGMKTFNAGTRYDFYVIQNKKCYTKTTIKDQEGIVSEQCLKHWKWLPNSNFVEIAELLGEGVDVYKNSVYFSTKVGKLKTDEFQFPLVHSTNKSGVRYLYSNVNNKGHFGISKVIFGDSGINDVIIDMEGCYGATEHAISIIVNSLREAEDLKIALLSKDFKKILIACSWSNFQIDYRLFKSFRKDFYKSFI